ncbi:hypothetical protein BAE36_06210 [Rhizobium leguminosarum bv. trifolii]|nr:hypothetical protein BAE36_06210 [Rhizobium leguminosarum bv. trifolii]
MRIAVLKSRRSSARVYQKPQHHRRCRAKTLLSHPSRSVAIGRADREIEPLDTIDEDDDIGIVEN